MGGGGGGQALTHLWTMRCPFLSISKLNVAPCLLQIITIVCMWNLKLICARNKFVCLGAHTLSGIQTHDPLIKSRKHEPIHQCSHCRGINSSTYCLRIDISFSSVSSFPLIFFFSMHLMARYSPLFLSSATTTSENAPLNDKKGERKKY